MVMDRCVKGLKWYGCSIPAAEKLDLSAVDIAQLAHAVNECILCHEGSDALFPNDYGKTCLQLIYVAKILN